MSDHHACLAPGLAVTRAAIACFRSDVSDCVAALWSDMKADIVLANDADLDFPQEHLDALCTATTLALSVPIEVDGDLPVQAVFLGRSGGRIVLRDPVLPTHAMTCLCAPGADLVRLRQAMVDFLAQDRQTGADR